MLCNGDCVRMPFDIWQTIKDASDWHALDVRDCSFDAVVVRTRDAHAAALLASYAMLASDSIHTRQVYIM